MTLISQKFSQVVQQTAYREFFMAELLTKPELIEQGLQFCIYWGYPQDNADLTLFQKITLEQKAAHYQRWLQSLGRGNTEYQEIWHHMSLLEKDPLTRLIATLCQQLGSTIERPMIQQVSPCMQEYTTLEKLMGLIQNLLDSCPQTQPIAIQLREEERRHPGFIAELTHKSSFSEMLEALVSYYHSNIICQKYPSSMIFSDRTQKPLGQRQQKSGLC
jgi:hypothetical protein